MDGSVSPPKWDRADIFTLHRRVVGNYRAYIESFINIADDAIRGVVQQAFATGQLWPEPLLQMNPAFEETGTVESLMRAGNLHRDCSSIFKGYRLYVHHQQAIELGLGGKAFVVTSGSGDREGGGGAFRQSVPIIIRLLRGCLPSKRGNTRQASPN